MHSLVRARAQPLPLLLSPQLSCALADTDRGLEAGVDVYPHLHWR